MVGDLKECTLVVSLEEVDDESVLLDSFRDDIV